MPYPAKTSPREILNEATAQLERVGADRLSVRAVAAALGLAPNALYRYYADRDALLAAVAEGGTRRLLAAVEDATRGLSGADGVRAFAGAYLRFARERPALYAALLYGRGSPAGHRPAHEDLRDLAAGLLGGVVGEGDAAEATVAVWGLLHGAAGLERAGGFGGGKPQEGIWFGLEALLRGMARP